DFREPAMTMQCKETGRLREHTINRNQEWVLEAKINITFWANSAQYDDAKAIAERELLAKIYGPARNALHRIRLAISNGDRRAAMAAVDFLQIEMEGEE